VDNLYASLFGPDMNSLARKLRAVVGDNTRGNFPRLTETIKHVDHHPVRDGSACIDEEALPGEEIKDAQALELPSGHDAVMDKVHGPLLVRSKRALVGEISQPRGASCVASSGAPTVRLLQSRPEAGVCHLDEPDLLLREVNASPFFFELEDALVPCFETLLEPDVPYRRGAHRDSLQPQLIRYPHLSP